jgi:MYXO-CTERM domain-containing protein
MINRDLWEIGYKKRAPATPSTAPAKPKAMGVLFFSGSTGGALALVGLAVLWARRRRRV